MVIGFKHKLFLTLVMGPHTSGKTKWCKNQQIILPHLMVIPYDEMLYALRREYRVSEKLKDVVTETVYNMMWELSSVSENIHIVIDGFPTKMEPLKRFVEASTKCHIVFMDTNVNQIVKNSARNKKQGLPYVKHNQIELMWRDKLFAKSPELHKFCLTEHVNFTMIDPFSLEKDVHRENLII